MGRWEDEMGIESKSARRDRKRREQEARQEVERREEVIRRANNPTLEERVSDIEDVLREHLGVILNGY